MFTGRPSNYAGIKRLMVFVDGGYLRKYLKDMFQDDSFDSRALIELIETEIPKPANLLVELIRVYFYDAIASSDDTVKYQYQQGYIQKLKVADQLEVRLGRLKKDSKGMYKQKGVDTLIAIDMLSKGYSDHYDIYFANHVSTELVDVFDKKLSIDKNWILNARRIS
jgi:hypothetical protein